MKICHLTSVHNLDDTRIFLKECSSLAKNKNYEVYLVGAGNSEIKNGVYMINLDNKYKNRLNRMFNFSKEVYKKALDIDADVYHLHDPELLRFALKFKKKGKKVIYDVHEEVSKQILSKQWIPNFSRKIISNLFERYEKNISKRLDYIITATPKIKDNFKKFTDRVCNVNNFPLLSGDVEYKESNFNKKERQICYVGALTEVRNIHNIIKAVNKADCKLVLAGPVEPGYKKYLESLPGWKKTEYFGIANRDQVSDIYSNSCLGVVILKGLQRYQRSLPVKMFEYMIAGLPIVCSDFSLWKEMVEKNNCGICVDPENIEEVSKAIEYLLDNRDKAKQMGQNGRNLVLTKCNWDIEERKLFKVYDELGL